MEEGLFRQHQLSVVWVKQLSDIRLVALGTAYMSEYVE